jgi:hypothetical protein
MSLSFKIMEIKTNKRKNNVPARSVLKAVIFTQNIHEINECYGKTDNKHCKLFLKKWNVVLPSSLIFYLLF